jgi:hypothetical protein
MWLTQIFCDGCGRRPSFVEWLRGEFHPDGYREWRHPGIAFKNAGLTVTYDTRPLAERHFFTLFGRPMPNGPGYLCPHCQKHVHEQLPFLVEEELGQTQQMHPPYYG